MSEQVKPDVDEEMEYCMEEDWETFKDQHPDVGESHETVFRYAYAQGWESRGLKDSNKGKKNDSWNDY